MSKKKKTRRRRAIPWTLKQSFLLTAYEHARVAGGAPTAERLRAAVKVLVRS